MRQGERLNFGVVTCGNVSHYVKEDGQVITTVWRYVFVSPEFGRLVYSGNFLGVKITFGARLNLRATLKRVEPAKYGGGWRISRPRILAMPDDRQKGLGI